MSGFSSFPITGIKADGQVHPRPEINAWASNNPIQLSLYIRALQIFQALPFEDVKSYFQIAGIHGLPAIPWDNDPVPMEASKSYNNNYSSSDGTPDFYCPHNSILFPTWHRVYVLLFEQRLWEIMNSDIVPHVTGDQRAVWQEAANTWRLPYWDWAADPSVPSVVRGDTVSIVDFDGKTVMSTSNPLYQFSTGAISTFKNTGSVPLFNDRSSLGQWTIFNDPPMDFTSGTSRWGLCNDKHNKDILTKEEAAGIQNNHLVDMALQDPNWAVIKATVKDKKGKTINIPTGLCGSILDQVSRLFVPSNFDNYAEFATTAHSGKTEPNGWLSLEMIHNYIHVMVGGLGWTLDPTRKMGKDTAQNSYGHMSDLGMAAYDPIFWLHHCNVDRQFAIYQNNNGKDQWFTGATKGTDPTPTDNLYPFHTDTKFNHWNSDGVKDWTTLGYTYPDLAPETDSSGPAPLELVQKRLTEKYGVLRRVLHEVGSTQNIEGLDNDYVINIIYNRFALNGVSYSIHFFIGKESDIPESPEDYKLSVDYIGGIHTFSSNYWTRGNENGVNCENCQKQQKNHQLSKGQLPVTLALLQRALHDDKRWAEISHLGKDHVVEYMTKHLHWRAVAVPNQLLKTDDLPDLKVFFKAGKAEHPEDAAKPSKYFGYEHQWGVTKDKLGGAKPE
ncbi:di-copper centre-containing protein [Fusarium napiforme]|uniref:tyrosinase n=1 Tax=Fusarium napiforme TaxID=42672 RepID=A0A8H5JKQ2_9HYPO|nr:di-copper centre-containing protein [Fusarium napiforme]